jgi:hypothetical protein
MGKLGKLPAEDLKRLLGCIKKDRKVVVQTSAGFRRRHPPIDCGKYLIVSTDPCIGVPEEWFGWLLMRAL